MTRSLIYKNKYETAYKVASEHSLEKGSEFAEAECCLLYISDACDDQLCVDLGVRRITKNMTGESVVTSYL